MIVAEEKKVGDATEAERFAEAEALAAEALRMAEEAKKAAERLAKIKATLTSDGARGKVSLTPSTEQSILSAPLSPMRNAPVPEQPTGTALTTTPREDPENSLTPKDQIEVEPKLVEQEQQQQSETQQPIANAEVNPVDVTAQKAEEESREDTEQQHNQEAQPSSSQVGVLNDDHPFDESTPRLVISRSEEMYDPLGGTGGICCDDPEAGLYYRPPKVAPIQKSQDAANKTAEENAAQVAAATCECAIL